MNTEKSELEAKGNGIIADVTSSTLCGSDKTCFECVHHHFGLNKCTHAMKDKFETEKSKFYFMQRV